MRLFLWSCILSGLSSFAGAQDLLWSDEFASGSDPDSSIWSFDVSSGGGGNSELQEYTTENVKIQDGSLIITTQKEDDGTITSGRIQSSEKLEFLYGTVEAKIKVPDPSNGLWPCLWMLGASFPEVGWPASGSFTIMQAGSANALELGKGKTIVGSAAHWEDNGQAASESNELDAPFDITADFYTYRMEWTPQVISTYVNDILIFTKDIASCSDSGCDEFHKPFYLVINVAAGGAYNQIFDVAEITAPLPAELVVKYIRIYDNGFTELSGSAAPNVSSPTPTLSPTTLSTAVPTEESTVVSTDSPTTAPTAVPTEQSTLVSTDSPTTAPSREVTPPPTLSPSNLPDLTATPSAATGPTESPTTQPLSASMQRFAAVGITMWLRNVEPLSPTLGVAWAEATGEHLAAEIKEAIGPELVESVDVSVALISQEPPFVRSRTLEGWGAARALRGLQTNQELTFNALIAIQSQVNVTDVNPYITGSFDSDAKNSAYVERLMLIGDAFDNAQVVSVAPATNVSRVQAPVDDTKNSNTNIGLIVGMVAVALVLCLVTFFVFALWRKTRTGRLGAFPRKKDSVSAIENDSIEGESVYINKAKNNTRAPSILDESLYTDDSQSTSHPSSQKSVDQDYDYEAAFKNLAASIADSQSGPSTLSSIDNTTLVNEFQVQVPAGKVGLVLETSYAGDPVVKEVKASSPMVGQVQVGDRLLSVDGENVSMVHATDVSRMIASKAGAPVRRFTFGRPRRET